jgi:heat shock protein HtpX
MGFISRSLLILGFLYALVFALGDVALLHSALSLWWGAAFAAALIGIQYLVSPWIIERLFSIYWDEDSVPAAQRDFLERLCREHGLPSIRLGIVESGTPNAFAFGRIRRDARIVVTRGLLDILSEQEIEAVLAHEAGHVAHYDFAIMALAALAPLLLYQIYVWTDRINNLRLVSYTAYLAYWIGQFLVLLLNRTREYGADHYSATVTMQPCNLSSALVKIGYGMVRERSEARRLVEEGYSSSKQEARRSLQFGHSLSLMGIASAANENALTLATTPAEAERVMRWDLVNPWARFYELGSTHPLTAMRLRALNRHAEALNQSVIYPLPADARTQWTGFPAQFLVWLAPLACGFVLLSSLWLHASLRRIGIVLPHEFVPWLLIALGATWTARIAFRYGGTFTRCQVRELLEDLDASQMRPRAVELEGEVIGHGVPGAFWSPDLVLNDESGMMFLLYRSSIPLGRLLFAICSADRFIGERITVKGWYRRGLKPYVEIRRIEARLPKPHSGHGPLTLFSAQSADTPMEYKTLVERAYSRWIQLAAAAIACGSGVILLLSQ